MKAHTADTYRSACTIWQSLANAIEHPVIIGIDEVGRGSLFGHLSVAGVILPADLSGEFDQLNLSQSRLLGINDSKKLTTKKREQLFDAIDQLCLGRVIVDVPAEVIDRIDIYQATLLGMRLAIERLINNHHLQPSNTTILIDGNAKPILSQHYQSFNLFTLIKGDGKHSSIACASILAKVHRDRQMNEYAKRYPAYGLDKHKGYASVRHKDAIINQGILPEHRKSFNPMRTMLELQNQHGQTTQNPTDQDDTQPDLF